MALTDAFPGAPGVADSVDLRKGLAGLIVRDTAGVARAGIFPRHTNALVTARSDMALDVAAFEGVSVRGGGPLFMANDGVAQSPASATAPASNSRIDVLYFKQNENGYGGFADGVNTPVFGVATGVAAASPTKPSIAGIAGAVELATVTIPSTATATNSSGVVITQTFQYTAAAGGMVYFRNASDEAAFTLPMQGQVGYRLDLGCETTHFALYNAFTNPGGKSVAVWVPADTGWTNFALVNGWVLFGSEAPGYIRKAGIVYLRGRAIGTNATSSTITSLPADFQPGMTIVGMTDNSSGTADRYVISSGGSITGGTNTVAFSLGGIAPFPSHNWLAQ